jgi:phosphodiesterase/alkaline phosphatase D-like protein
MAAYQDIGIYTAPAARRAHHVTLRNLAPETTYYFRVHSGDAVDDNGGQLYQFTTGATELPLVPYLAYGQVETGDGGPAVGALVRAWLLGTGLAA